MKRFETRRKAWRDLPIGPGSCKGDVDNCDYGDVTLDTNGRVVLTFSGVFGGAGPVEMRFIDDAASGQKVLAPGALKIRKNARAVSFTFVCAAPRTEPCAGIRMQWRSPSGAPVSVADRTTVIRYERSARTEPLGCA